MKCFLQVILLAAIMTFVASASQSQVFFANLTGPGESPPNSSPGIGIALVTLNPATNSMRVQVTFSNLSAPTTASHIHSATPSPGAGTAGVATTVPTFPLFPLGATSGTYDQTFDMTQASSYNPAFVTANGGTPLTAEAALFSGIRSGEAYLNIHTTAFPNGEIRGFLAPVPEPGALGLLAGMGAGGAISVMIRRRFTFRRHRR
jgi:hypothetical protein